MPADVKSLTKNWIQYLKSNKIVALNSDPETGKLKYNRPVTSDDVMEFLDVKTDFSPEQVSNAIHMIMARKGLSKQSPKLQSPAPKEPGRGLSTWTHHGMTPAERQPKKMDHGDIIDMPQAAGPESRLKYNPKDVSDIDFKEKSAEDEKNSNKKPKRLKEEITDIPKFTLDEQDVELLFNILSSGAVKPNNDNLDNERNLDRSKKDKEIDPAEVQARKEEDFRKIKRLIRDVMTDSQRKAFWRMLNDSETLEESQINNADIRAILNTAAEKRNKPSGLGKIFKGLRKDKISVDDLHQAWKKEGYPDDTRDIKALLLGHGFSEKEIKKVFSEVFGTEKSSGKEEPDIPRQSETLLKIVKHAKNSGLTQDIIDFMSKEYGFKESFQIDKIMIEDIKRVFTSIVQENRSGREALIQTQDRANLGRTKK